MQLISLLMTYFELILRFISAAVIGRSRAKNLSSIGLGVVEVEVEVELLSLDYKYTEVSFEIELVKVSDLVVSFILIILNGKYV